MLQVPRAWDGNDPGLLGQQPGDRDLRGCRILPCGDAAEQTDHRLVGFPVLWSEAWESATKVCAVEGHRGINSPCEESLPQRAPGNEADSEFLAYREHFRFRVSRPQ